MKKHSDKNINDKLKALADLPDENIDYSDIPSSNIDDWQAHSLRAEYYRPIKQPVTIRLDADVIDWFKTAYPKYQSAVNQALRDHMNSHRHF